MPLLPITLLPLENVVIVKKKMLFMLTCKEFIIALLNELINILNVSLLISNVILQILINKSSMDSQ